MAFSRVLQTIIVEGQIVTLPFREVPVAPKNLFTMLTGCQKDKRQAGRQTDRKTDGHTDRKTERQI